MGTLDRKRVVEFALSQVGYEEDPPGSNKQKYGAMLDQMPWYLYKDGSKEWIHKVNSFDWCTQFVDSCFILTYTIDIARKMLYRPKYNNYGAVVRYAFEYFKSVGKGWKKEDHEPKVGDVIYFQNSKGLSHTGIVVSVGSDTVTTVEGNAGTGNNFVKKNTYKKITSYIYGYGEPGYDEEEEEMKFTDLKELKYVKGNVMKGDAVRIVQSVVKCDVDGSYGPKTEAAVKDFQRKEGITIDGWVGPVTWERIWRKAE